MWQLRGNVILRDGVTVGASEIEKALAESEAAIRHDLPSLRFSQRTLTVQLEISGDFPERLSASGVVVKGSEAVSLGESDHLVVGGTWHPVDPVSLAAAQTALGGLQTREITAGQYLRLLASIPADDLIDKTSHELASTWSKTREQLSPPPGLQATLFPYQVIGATAMRMLAEYDLGSLLADEMGLGKTVQAITLLLDQRDKGTSLVVAPAALLPNWRRELSAFSPTLSVHDHGGSRRSGVAEGLLGSDVVLTSYETVVNDIAIFDDIEWNVVVLDEAQSIRNPDAQRSQAVKRLNRRISVAVTGTPMENALRDIWSVSEFVLPHILGDREAFEREFANDVEAAKAVGSLVSPITIRRPVSEVATDLPERVDILSEIVPDSADQQLLGEMRSSDPGISGITRMQIMCAHADDMDSDATRFGSRPKVLHALRLIQEACGSGDKVLVFAGYQNTLDRLALAARPLDEVRYLAVIDGRVSPTDRQMIIDEFTAASGGGVLFLNPQAAGVGLNITAANHVIHFSPHWNPAVTAQATARSYRRRQSKPVFVHHLFYGGTIEQDVIDSAAFKRTLAAGVDEGLIEGG